jgi:hypothetical protein
VLLQAFHWIQDNEGHQHRHTIGEILEKYYKKDFQQEACYEALLRCGIHPIYDNGDCIDIAVRHTVLSGFFKASHFNGRWNDYFSRAEGARPSVFRPTGGRTIRSIRVPRTAFMSVNQTELL